MFHSQAHKMSGIVSNIAGPKQPYFMAGQRMRSWIFWVSAPQLAGAHLGVSVSHYMDEIRIGLTLPTNTGYDVRQLAEDMAAATEKLMESSLATAELAADLRAPCGEAAIEDRCSAGHQALGYVVGVAVAPVFEMRTFDPLIECAECGSAVDLEIDTLILDAFERESSGVDEIPAKDQRELVLWVLFSLFYLGRSDPQVIFAGFGVDFGGAFAEVLGFDLAAVGSSISSHELCRR